MSRKKLLPLGSRPRIIQDMLGMVENGRIIYKITIDTDHGVFCFHPKGPDCIVKGDLYLVELPRKGRKLKL
jgi:hypothetical protein